MPDVLACEASDMEAVKEPRLQQRGLCSFQATHPQRLIIRTAASIVATQNDRQHGILLFQMMCPSMTLWRACSGHCHQVPTSASVPKECLTTEKLLGSALLRRSSQVLVEHSLSFGGADELQEQTRRRQFSNNAPDR